MLVRRFRALTLVAALFTLSASVPAAQTKAPAVTTPKEFFGFNIGDDYQLANYTQFIEYWQKLDKESDRMKVVEIGKTAEGRPQLMAIITSPENFKKLDRYKEISRRLALAEGLTDEQARALAKEGKAVVWIDGGLHATEVLGAQQLIETVYQLVSRNDAETMRFLQRRASSSRVHANPDGMELVSNWYMRETRIRCSARTNSCRGSTRSTSGHDNNRDFYMSNQPETQNMNQRAVPRVVPADHVQPSPDRPGRHGDVRAAVPRSVQLQLRSAGRRSSIDLVGAAMHKRFVAEGKPGVTMRSGSSYSTWWNGGLRTTAYFHNMIGLLTETIGNPTPMHDSVRRRRKQLPRARPAVPDRAAGVALPPVDRLLGDGQLRGARLRVALPGELPLQHLPDGEELDRARQPRQLDAPRRVA